MWALRNQDTWTYALWFHVALKKFSRKNKSVAAEVKTVVTFEVAAEGHKRETSGVWVMFFFLEGMFILQ